MISILCLLRELVVVLVDNLVLDVDGVVEVVVIEVIGILRILSIAEKLLVLLII